MTSTNKHPIFITLFPQWFKNVFSLCPFIKSIQIHLNNIIFKKGKLKRTLVVPVENYVTRHFSIAEHNKKWNYFYPTRGIQSIVKSFRRVLFINQLHYNSNSTLNCVVMTSKGIQITN